MRKLRYARSLLHRVEPLVKAGILEKPVWYDSVKQVGKASVVVVIVVVAVEYGHGYSLCSSFLPTNRGFAALALARRKIRFLGVTSVHGRKSCFKFERTVTTATTIVEIRLSDLSPVLVCHLWW